MKIKVIKDIENEQYLHIIMTYKCKYIIIKNCKMKSLSISNPTQVTIKCIIILNCVMDHLMFNDVKINTIYINNSIIQELGEYYTENDDSDELNFGSKINYLKLHNSNIELCNLNGLNILSEKFKFEEKSKNIIKTLNHGSTYFNYKKFNKKSFYSL